MPKPEMIPMPAGPAIAFMMHVNTLWEETGTPAAEAAEAYIKSVPPADWISFAMRFARLLYTIVQEISDESPEEFYARVMDRD